MSVRIGIDAREAFRLHPRGIGLYVRHLMREFSDLAADQEFLLYHERDLPEDMPPIPENMRPVRTEIRGGRWNSWERIRMPWQIRRDKISVYHGTYNTLPPSWPLWSGPPLMVTVHDLIVTWHDESLDDPYVRYCRAVTPRVLRDAKTILTVSEWSRQDIINRHGVAAEKVQVFFNGISPEFLAGAPEGSADKARLRFANGQRYLFALGSSLRRKNTNGLIDALGLLHSRGHLDLPCLISGLNEAQQKPFRERAARAGLAQQILFLPYLTRKDLIDLYAGAELCIYPSLIEGWGIPVIESLALGTPVVTSQTSGMQEAGGDHAFYFDPTDLDSMASGIEDALRQRESWIAQTQPVAIERARSFTWRKAAETTLQAYLNLAR